MPPVKRRSAKYSIPKHTIRIAGRKTSVSLEDAFWSGLKEIAAANGVTVDQLVEAVDAGRAQLNLSSALRLYVLAHFRDGDGPGDAAEEDEAARLSGAPKRQSQR